MKVRIAFTVDVHPARWAEEYGLADRAGDIRRDVQDSVRYSVLAQLESLGLLA